MTASISSEISTEVTQGQPNLLEVKVRIPKEADISRAEGLVESCCAEEGLMMTVKRTLRMDDENVHWHFKKSSERGTLEITLLRGERAMSLYVHDNRRGAWTGATARKLKTAIEKGLMRGHEGGRNGQRRTVKKRLKR